jgi:hypothetical protein
MMTSGDLGYILRTSGQSGLTHPRMAAPGFFQFGVGVFQPRQGPGFIIREGLVDLLLESRADLAHIVDRRDKLAAREKEFFPQSHENSGCLTVEDAVARDIYPAYGPAVGLDDSFGEASG